MKKSSSLFIIYTVALFITQPALAQQSRWQFVGRSSNGSVSYLEAAGLQHGRVLQAKIK